jgi:hypothetical protein
MPREDRRIYFDYSELYKAVYALSVQNGIKKPPPGVVVTMSRDKDDPKKITATIENPLEKDSARTVEYSSDFVAAALMLFCRGHNIPISKKARKSVEISGSDVVLRLEI